MVTGSVRPACFRLAEQGAIVRLGGRAVAFSEPAQTLYELNDSAALLAAQLQQGASFDDLVGRLVGHGFAAEDAPEAVRSLLLAWSRAGLLSTEAPPGDGVVHSQSIGIAGISARIDYADAALAGAVAPALAHLEAQHPGDCALRFSLSVQSGLAFLSRNRGSAALAAPEQAAPVLKAALTEAVMETTGARIALHCACLERSRRALLLSGSPGAGKTTLALTLAARGFTCWGDDIALLGADGLVTGAPFAPGVKQGAWDLVRRVRPDLDGAPVHQRLDGQLVRYLPLPLGAAPRPLPFGWFIQLDRNEDGPSGLTPLDPAEALSEIMAGAYAASNRLSAPMLHLLVRLLSEARLYRLRYAECDEAAALLDALCDG